MGRRESAQAKQREADGDIVALRKLPHFRHCFGKNDAVPSQDHRPLRAVNQFERLLVFALRGRQVRPVSGHLRNDGLAIEFARHLLRVLGDIDKHRTRTAGTGDVKRFADRARNLARMGDQIIVLRDGKRDARDVGLLKRVGTDELAANLPRNADDGRRIEHRPSQCR
jgi:hypothetical protein